MPNARPYARLSGDEIIALVHQGDADAIAEAREHRTTKSVRAALAIHDAAQVKATPAPAPAAPKAPKVRTTKHGRFADGTPVSEVAWAMREAGVGTYKECLAKLQAANAQAQAKAALAELRLNGKVLL